MLALSMAIVVAVAATVDSTLVFSLDPKDHDLSKILLLAVAEPAGSQCTAAPMVSIHLVDYQYHRLLLASQASGIP